MMNLIEIEKRMKGLESGEVRTVCCGELDYGKIFNVIYDAPIATELVSATDKVRLKGIIDAWCENDLVDSHIEELLTINFGREKCSIKEYFGCNPYDSEAACDDDAFDITANYLRTHSSRLVLMDLTNFLRNLLEADKQLVRERRMQLQHTLKKTSSEK